MRWKVETGQAERIALVAPTAADVRDVMIFGKSGIHTISPPWNKPHFSPTNRSLTWKSGARALLFSAEEPDRLNGPQFDAAWADELGVWPDIEAWRQLQFALRLGENPQCVITTTPKPNPLTRALLKQLATDERTVVTTGSTFENAANLSADTLIDLRREYEGTRLGREQLYGDLLDDDRDRLLMADWFETVRHAPDNLRRLRFWDMAATDPDEQARTRKKNKDNDPDWTVGALLGKTPDGIYYILDIARFRKSPHENKLAIRACAQRDGQGTPLRMEQEPGSAGKTVIDTYRRDVLAGFAFKGVRSTGGKDVRAVPFAQYAEAGHVKVLDRPWTRALLEEFDHFGEPDWHDDQVDACAGAFAELSGVRPTARPASVPVSTPDQAYRQQQARYVPQTTTRRRPGIGIAFR